MNGLWVFAHLLGFTLWLGGAFASMAAGIAGKREERAQQAAVARLQAALHRLLIGPGALLTVLTGLMLTLRVYGALNNSGSPSGWLAVMQVAGLIGALLVLFVAVPTAGRLGRLDPTGAQGPLFDELRARQAIIGSVGGTLGLIALLAGALVRH